MSLDSSQLLDFLEEIQDELERKIVLVAVGGTAMTLLGLKPSTIDMDFTGPGVDVRLFDEAQKAVPHGFKIDAWPDGQVFSQILPADYLGRSRLIADMQLVELRALHPVDIVVTKIGRMDERDIEDIGRCIVECNLTRDEIIRRARQVQYVGNERVWSDNLEYVLNRFF
jgi:hypothetical protein